MPIGLDNISLPSEEIRKKIHEEAMYAHLVMSGDGQGDTGEHKRKWRRGEQDFEALMRHLDNMVRLTAPRLLRYSGFLQRLENENGKFMEHE